LLAFSALACTNPASISEMLGKLTRDTDVTTVDLTQVTQFAWDEVYLFAPYTQRKQVCATLKIPAKDCERFIPFEANDDSEMTLAFVLQHCMVRYVRHGRRNGDFMPLPQANVVAEEDARFRVVRGGSADGKDWPRLVLVPVAGSVR
jgi:hypothetical protein